jgi:hypothetical protein
VALGQTSTVLCASLDLIINLITAAAPGALLGVAVWRHQNKTHKQLIMTALITVVPFSVCLCMQNEVDISALTKIPGFWCAADTTSKLCSTCVVLALMASCQDCQQQTLLVFLSSKFSNCSHHDCKHSLQDAYQALDKSNITLYMCVHSMVQPSYQDADHLWKHVPDIKISKET